MNKIFKLHNQIKNYEWGSPQILPEFLNLENKDNIPFAEMWMGTHKGAPSQIQTDDKLINLSEINGQLPFLLKMIAIEKPLSIQAHPNREQALEGFNKEEAIGIAVDAPQRNYKDSNHKPEVICAIKPITLMAGFRQPQSIAESLESLLLMQPALKEIIMPLICTLKSDSLSYFFRILFNLSNEDKEYLCSFIKNCPAGGVITNEQWKLMKKFAGLYPKDPAIMSPLYLNILTLQAGQAIFVPAGILHAYTSGFGVELMSSSDNVLRGGLTPKYVDIEELMKVLQFTPFIPQIISPSAGEKWFCYHTSCDEFLLGFMRCNNNDKNIFPGNCPAICIVTEGELKAGDMVFKKGDSFFISEKLLFEGNFTLFAASICEKNPV